MEPFHLVNGVSCNLSVVGCCEDCWVGRGGEGGRGQRGRQHGRGQGGLDLNDDESNYLGAFIGEANITYQCYDW